MEDPKVLDHPNTTHFPMELILTVEKENQVRESRRRWGKIRARYGDRADIKTGLIIGCGVLLVLIVIFLRLFIKSSCGVSLLLRVSEKKLIQGDVIR